MKLSRYFQELMLAYKAELDDMRTDSEGKDVMRFRLKEKREQLPFLIAMMAENPEMLAPAFHGAFMFMNPLSFESIVSKEGNKLPSWKSLSSAVKLEPWAEKMAKEVLADEAGDRFMVTAACLEYLNRGQQTRAQAVQTVDDEESENDDGFNDQEESDVDGHYGRYGRDDGDDGDDRDLEEAGADWLAEQGFDRKD